ncbi:hypothetical protein ALC62_06013 [Cyphomyrmex costatus]|uniref:Uncharacterized protein n=1 Tax=Cyphomyrmex costatus TaxID=456900 RepID=A0A195CR17_9HYME|nr:hypothetical protein ALC62_06013 [Cyphomyrmex costatus]
MRASVVEYLRIGFFAFLSLQRERDTRSVFRDCSPLPYRTFRERLTASCKPMTTTTRPTHTVVADRQGRQGARASKMEGRRAWNIKGGTDLSRCATPLRDCFRTDERAERINPRPRAVEGERERERYGRDPRTAVLLVCILASPRGLQALL